MTTVERFARLEASLAELADIETAILDAVHRLEDRVAPHPHAHALLIETEHAAHEHITALRDHFRTLTGNELKVTRIRKTPGPGDEHGITYFHPVSSSLRTVYTLLHQAVIGYSTLTLLGARFRDSWAAADEGTAAHIGRDFTQEYMATIGRITETVHDVVCWELDEEGLECWCTCPACSVGVCAGPTSIRVIFAEAWNAARPPAADNGVVLHPPRVGSAADEAGFRNGDVIVAVDGVKVDSLSVLQKAVREHLPADQINFAVRRNGDVISLVVERRSDLDFEPAANEVDCTQPAGTEFFRDRARDIQQRVRDDSAAVGITSAGLSSLSAREIQVLRLAADGSNNPEIAEELGIKRATVARHIANILEKLGAANRTEAVSIAATGGLLSYA